MNSVFLSPHFPPNFRTFAARLKEAGATVLGLGDEPYERLSPELKENLSEYFRVNDMGNYDELLRALGHFTHRHGKLNHLDSHNEFWLESEAKLRTDFNIPGVNVGQIDKIKRKSEMKRIFQQAGLKPARGRVCATERELRDFIKEVGLPVVAKPDIGVGAAGPFLIDNEGDIQHYLREKPPCEYIVEEFISGQIISYDGLVDPDGKLVFSSSLRYSKGVMEAVNEDSDIYYYIVRDIEPWVEQAGLSTLKSFDVRARFFHFEFFLRPDHAIPLEVNMRPPGGLTLQMFNYAFDFDCFKTWANMIVKGVTETVGPRRYYVMYVGRKDHIPYAMPHSDVLHEFDSLIVQHERIDSVFARAIGNYGFILRHHDLEPLIEAAEAIQFRA
ncbi:MAG: ATP-grasp domain-containing protein [Terriglobales bacterium]